MPDFVAVVIALGFFTSARIAEQVKAGIQALPEGQRYAGLADGPHAAADYRYVLLPMAFRIVIPPLTSESMNIIKNSSVAFAVSITELTFFAMQAQEETSRGVEIYLAVTVPVLHLGLRHQPHRRCSSSTACRCRACSGSK